MANLLPIPEQKKIWRMYRGRFIIAASCALIALSVLAGLSVIPAKLALSFATIEPENVSVSGEGVDEPIAMAKAQAIIRSFGPALSATTTPSDSIRAIMAVKPDGVFIEKVQYAPGSIVLSGRAAREAIEAFRTELGELSMLTGVSVPVSALVGREENRFSITLTGNL